MVIMEFHNFPCQIKILKYINNLFFFEALNIIDKSQQLST